MTSAPDNSPLDAANLAKMEREFRKALLTVAKLQKCLQYCVLAFTAGAIGQLAESPHVRLAFGIGLSTGWVIGVVSALLLAVKIHGLWLGVPLGFFSAVPPLGFLTMLLINQSATVLLREHGFKVGLFGANLSHVSRPPDN